LPDASVDGITMAFGIRNVPDRSLALSEMRRVTRSGGKVAILELSEPRRGVLSAVARFHMHRVVPFLGALLSGSREYRYLPESIAAFPPAEQFVSLLHEAGFTNARGEALTFGVCHLYVAEVP
jgi:demethylmenaquinone methyltransferase/2-methoxy-6-polyprenyl-1,4-benzoquinol methylase